jgi:hypothetical protein
LGVSVLDLVIVKRLHLSCRGRLHVRVTGFLMPVIPPLVSKYNNDIPGDGFIVLPSTPRMAESYALFFLYATFCFLFCDILKSFHFSCLLVF